ncbi:MAG: hypothetical protein Ct9H300mP12_05250 [Acidimicrobiales bacterium]|nr:MAG: hypothetical protein Ct9H300mP12_05250 [Acidimicrobiales bacterium]
MAPRGPWRATPNLMVVVPTAEDVRLYYGRTTVDVVAILLSVVGLVALVGIIRRPRPMPGPALFDVAAAGPDGDRRLDRWVDRRVADAILGEIRLGDRPVDRCSSRLIRRRGSLHEGAVAEIRGGWPGRHHD